MNLQWMKSNQLTALALGVVFSSVLVGCGSNSSSNAPEGTTGSSASNNTTPQGDVIKVGIVASVSGDNKPWGDDQKEGADLAVKEFNDAGGLGGKKVELILGDSGSKPEQAKTAAEKILSEGVIGIVGEVSSGNTIQIANSARSKGVPVVAVGATRTDLTNDGGV